MKKCLIAVSLAAAAFSASVLADDGRINFYGSITDSACTVVNNMSNPLSVMMGNVSSSAFTGAGSTASPTKFNIAPKIALSRRSPPRLNSTVRRIATSPPFWR